MDSNKKPRGLNGGRPLGAKNKPKPQLQCVTCDITEAAIAKQCVDQCKELCNCICNSKPDEQANGQ